MRIFKNKIISKFTKKHHITDTDLYEAIARAESGLIDADLGSGVIKQRIARQGQGRSGGYRSLILFKQTDRAFFMLAFAKNDRDNITPAELADLKRAALIMFALTEEELQAAIDNETLTEIHHDL